jgi:hypothetical protein
VTAMHAMQLVIGFAMLLATLYAFSRMVDG